MCNEVGLSMAYATPVSGPDEARYPALVQEADSSADASQNKEIKLWNRAVLPLTGSSVSHDDFKALPVAPPPRSQRVGYTPNPHKLDSRTTTGDAYQAWTPEPPIPPPSQPAIGYTPSPYKVTNAARRPGSPPP